DDLPFSKQSWRQRNRTRTAAGLSYVTVPVRTAGRLGQRIIDTQLANTMFADKMIRTISQSYARAAYFSQYLREFCSVLTKAVATESLCELNCALIDWLAAQLHVTTARVRSSEL